MKVLGISGSLRRDSHNRGLLLEAAKAFPAGVEFELYDRLGALPHYDEDADVEPATRRCRRSATRSQAPTPS